jgi:hypothetical protein
MLQERTGINLTMRYWLITVSFGSLGGEEVDEALHELHLRAEAAHVVGGLLQQAAVLHLYAAGNQPPERIGPGRLPRLQRRSSGQSRRRRRLFPSDGDDAPVVAAERWRGGDAPPQQGRAPGPRPARAHLLEQRPGPHAARVGGARHGGVGGAADGARAARDGGG